MLRAAIALALLLAVAGFHLVQQPGAAAAAEQVCEEATAPGGGIVEICVEAPGSGDPGEIGGGDGGADVCRSSGGVVIPCQIPWAGYWFAAQDCYAQPATVPPTSELWGEQDPSSGSFWTCRATSLGLAYPPGEPFFVGGGAAPLPDPAVLAQQALDQMQLATPDVNLAPAPPLMSYVGLETWLWMPEGQWSTLTNSVTAGATTVTVEAVPVRTTWDLEVGSTTCASAGRAWVRGMGDSAQTDCSYTFDRVSDADGFAVSAVLTYQVDWTCTGACLAGAGSLDEVDGLPGAAAIRVGERQSVVTSGG